MKLTVRIIQFIVGILFIVSGLVKANDPLGLSYKMQEFFELWNSELNAGHFFARNFLVGLFEFLHENSLPLAIVMITLEIILGVALLLGRRKKLVLYSLLLLMVFFTFLTGYAYLSGKFTNCGCFGDCLPISPMTSFIKDLVLLAFIIILLARKKFIEPVLTIRLTALILFVSFLASIIFQWYALQYLPPVDCLPFKKGNSIAEQMKPPRGAITDSTAIRYIYEKNGKRFEWAPEQLPQDFESYTYVDRIDKLVRKGNAEPRIKGFSLTDTMQQDHTTEVLSAPEAILIFALDAGNTSWINNLGEIIKDASTRQVPVYLATSMQESFMKILSDHHFDIPVYACDFTVIRTAARTEPTVYLLKKGTIVNKFSVREFNKIPGSLDRLKSVK
jgi:hypothetical protein